MNKTLNISQALDSELQPHVVEFVTELVGKINNQDIQLIGKGTIDEENGINEGVFEIVKLPEEIDGRSLGAFLFTGYPNSCRIPQKDITNPFIGGSYSYTRSYYFDKTGHEAVLKVICKLDRQTKRLTSKFELNGSMPKLKNVRGVSPIFELWSPEGKRLRGSFGVAWLDGEKSSAATMATAISDYLPVDSSRLGGRPKHRYLKLDSSYEDSKHLYVKQTSELVDV